MTLGLSFWTLCAVGLGIVCLLIAISLQGGDHG